MSKKKNNCRKPSCNHNNNKKDISPEGRAMIESVSNLKDVEFAEDLDELYGRRPYNRNQKEYNFVNSPIE